MLGMVEMAMVGMVGIVGMVGAGDVAQDCSPGEECD